MKHFNHTEYVMLTTIKQVFTGINFWKEILIDIEMDPDQDREHIRKYV
jgi:hypothetical protein